MSKPATLLLEVLRDPMRLLSLSEPQWDALLPQARAARVLGRLAVLIDGCEGVDRLPTQAADHLLAERRLARQHTRVMRYEVSRIERALADVAAPLVLLKGGAYVMAGLPAARGRLFADVDIMTPREQLGNVEQALLRGGWQFLKTHPYDQRYYRQWMHELPPLEHAQRKTVLDVHHTILPLTGRVKLDATLLFEQARPLPDSRLCVLSEQDMVLHCAAHMFQDGELDGSVRDLIDLHDLLSHFGKEAAFWPRLHERAGELNLGRPLAYAVRYARQLLNTPVPESSWQAVQGDLPRRGTHVMDSLVHRAIVPDGINRVDRRARLARLLLYIRSHWLRMPPMLLAAHLMHKTIRRVHEDDAEDGLKRR